MSVSMAQFGQKLPVLPLLGNMKSRLEPKPEEHHGHFHRARGSNERVFGQMIECY
jgi:hypothetical protein